MLQLQILHSVFSCCNELSVLFTFTSISVRYKYIMYWCGLDAGAREAAGNRNQVQSSITATSRRTARNRALSNISVVSRRADQTRGEGQRNAALNSAGFYPGKISCLSKVWFIRRYEIWVRLRIESEVPVSVLKGEEFYM
jgi:hypothetical protein